MLRELQNFTRSRKTFEEYKPAYLEGFHNMDDLVKVDKSLHPFVEAWMKTDARIVAPTSSLVRSM